MVCLQAPPPLNCQEWLAEIRQVQARTLTPVALVLTKKDLLEAE